MTTIVVDGLSAEAISQSRCVPRAAPAFAKAPTMSLFDRTVAVDAGSAVGVPTPRLSMRLLVDGFPTPLAADNTWTAPGVAAVSLQLEVVASNGVAPDAVATGATVVPAAIMPPARFDVADWALSDAPTPSGERLWLDVLTLPGDGGSAITAIEARVEEGAVFKLVGVGVGRREIAVGAGALAQVEIRGVNAAGAGLWSAAKSATATKSAPTPLSADPSLVFDAVAANDPRDVGTWAAGDGLTRTLVPMDWAAASRELKPFLLTVSDPSGAVSTIVRSAGEVSPGSRWRLVAIAKAPAANASDLIHIEARDVGPTPAAVSAILAFTGPVLTIPAQGSFGTLHDFARTDLGDGWFRFEATLTVADGLVAADTGLVLLLGPGVSPSGGAVILSAGGAAEKPRVDASLYATRDPIRYPFAPDSIWRTPISQAAVIETTTAFDIPTFTASTMRLIGEEHGVVVALPPHDYIGIGDGADSVDVALAHGGHPLSPDLEEVAWRVGRTSAHLQAAWPNRSPGWSGAVGQPGYTAPAGVEGNAWLHPTSPRAQIAAGATDVGWSRTGVLLPRDWKRTNKPLYRGANDPLPAAGPDRDDVLDYDVAWDGDVTGALQDLRDVNDVSLQGNTCTTVITEHPESGSTAMIQTLGLERPAFGSDVWSLGLNSGVASVAPTGSQVSGVARTGYNDSDIALGWLGIEAGPQSTRFVRGATPTNATMRRFSHGWRTGGVRWGQYDGTITDRGVGLGNHEDASFAGAHMGAQLSVIGTTIYADELCAEGSAVDTIRHALSLVVTTAFLHFDNLDFPLTAWTANGDNESTVAATQANQVMARQPALYADAAQTPGSRYNTGHKRARLRSTFGGRMWPATAYDFEAWPQTNRPGAQYQGADPKVRMGAHLCLPASFDLDTLTTLPAKRIAWALQHFGAYVNDVVPQSHRTDEYSVQFGVQEDHIPGAPVGDRVVSVTKAMMKRFGHPFAHPRRTGGDVTGPARMGPSGQGAAWKQDVYDIIKALRVVTSTAELAKAGGGDAPFVIPRLADPISLIGGFFYLDGVRQDFADLTLYRARPGDVLEAQTTDVFDRAHTNRATGADLTNGAAIWGDLDRGWYRIGNADGSRLSPPIWLELGAKRFGSWVLS